MSDEALSQALVRLAKQEVAKEIAPDLARAVRASGKQKAPGWWRDPEAGRAHVALVQALFAARRISAQEYVFLAAAFADRMHEGRILGKFYPELERIGHDMDAIRVRHGLAEEQYWRAGEGPQEYEDRDIEWRMAYDKRFIEVLRECSFDDVARLAEGDSREFERLRERGRRRLHHKGEINLVTMDIVVRYEIEAQRSASVQAYTAAITLLGAAVEGLLLLRCLRAKQKARKFASTLPKGGRPSKVEDPSRWTFNQLIETCLAAGWLPEVPMEMGPLQPEGLAHILRKLRNFVHPGKVATERPWIEADEHEYNDAVAIHSALKATLSARRSKRRLHDMAQMPEVSDAVANALEPVVKSWLMTVDLTPNAPG